MFLAVSFITGSGSHADANSDQTHLELYAYIAVGMFILSTLIGMIVFKIHMKRISSLLQPDTEFQLSFILPKYIIAHLLRIALLEMAVLFSLVTFFLYRNTASQFKFDHPAASAPLFIFGIFFLLMVYYFPTEAKIKSQFTKNETSSSGPSSTVDMR